MPDLMNLEQARAALEQLEASYKERSKALRAYIRVLEAEQPKPKTPEK